MVPEIGEEHEEDGAVHPDEVNDGGVLVVTAGQEVVLRDVQRNQDELDLERERGQGTGEVADKDQMWNVEA